MGRRMFRDEIDYFHAPKVSIEVLFAVWSEKVAQRRCGGGPLRNGSQKLGRGLRDAVIAQQRFAEARWLSSGPRYVFVAGDPECVSTFIDQVRAVGCINGQR